MLALSPNVTPNLAQQVVDVTVPAGNMLIGQAAPQHPTNQYPGREVKSWWIADRTQLWYTSSSPMECWRNMMDTKIEGLVRLIDQAIALAQERLKAKRAGSTDPASIEGLEQIISGLQYRRNEAISSGFPVYDSYVTLGLVRAALEYDVPDSDLVHKIGDIERYFLQHFVRNFGDLNQ